MSKRKENYLTFSDLLELFTRHWKLFFLSLFIALSAAAWYIITTPPIYQKKASILIKDESKGKSISQASQGFDDLGLLKSNTNINNEISIMRTPILMEEVVRRLKLDYNYSVKYKKVRWVDLYNGSPVKVELDSMLLGSNMMFSIDILSNNNFSLSEIKLNGMESELILSGEFNVPLETGFGKITIIPTEVFNPNSENKQIYFSKNGVRSVAASLLSRLSVVLRSENTSIIDLSLVDGVAQRAEDALNTLISVYNENWIKDRNLITLSTSQFINERLKVIEKELGTVDDDISAYKSKNLLPDVAAVANMHLTQSSVNANKQLSLNNQLSMAQYIRQYMQDATTGDQLLPANTGISNSSIESQIGKYNDLLLQKNNLLANSSQNNPVVADMITKLDAMKEIINRSIEDLIGSLTIQIENTRKEERVNDARIATNPTQAKYLLSVERQQKVKEELYLFLLQKREEMELSQAFTAYNTRVLIPAGGTGGSAPVKPRKQIIILFALIAGILLPVFLLLIKESMNTLVWEKKDLEGLTIPFLGIIPLAPKMKMKSAIGKKRNVYIPKVVIEDKNRNMINEAFRVIRTNIDFMNLDNQKNKVFMFISTLPGSGKSFISANLALSVAIKDSKVLIIDTDLRKASLSTYIGSPKTGLSNYLSGQIENIDDIIAKGEMHPNLDVIPAGTIPPNPSELLLTERFGDLISQMRERYDYIYLDCTPIDIVSDASIVVKHCDISVFIIRAGLMDKRMLPELEQIYKNKRYKEMCVLLNGVRYTNSYRKYGYYGN